MASAALRSAILSLLRGLPPTDGTDDAALLQRFVAWRDEAAFELLVYRHGPMVRGVWRRLRGRLLRRGLAPAAGLTLERALAEAADAGVLSGAVVRPVVRAALAFVQNPSLAAGAVSVSAAGLAHEVLHTMYVTRLTWT